MKPEYSSNSNIYPGYQCYTFGKKPRKFSIEVNPIPKPDNVWKMLQLFNETLENKNTARAMQGTILKYLTPALGGKNHSSKQRMTEKDKSQSAKYLEGCPVEKLEKISIDNLELTRPQKSHVKSLIDWATENGWIHPPEDTIIAFSFKAAQKQRKHLEDLPPTGVRQGNNEKIVLGAFEEDYVQIGSKKYLANTLLEVQIEKLKTFLKNGVLDLATATVEGYIGNILRFLGWLHRHKSIPLQDINLDLVAPYVKLKFDLSEFEGDAEAQHFGKIVEEAKAIEQLKKISKAQVKLFKEYIEHTNIRPGSAVKIYNSFLCVAYWVYQDDTEKQRKREGWEDIPLVSILREARLIYSREEEKEKKSSRVGLIHRANGYQTDNNGAYLCDWTELLEACDRHRIEAMQKYRYNVRTTRVRADGKPSTYKLRRKDNAIFQNWIRFIQLALIIATPPGRSKDYYTLQYGNNLLKGEFVKGKFQDHSEMDTPEDAQWWIYLTAENYKTGKAYGTFLNQIPNIKFPGLKALYDYLEEYVVEWLPKYSPTRHLFVTMEGKPFDSGVFGSKLQNSLNRYGFAPMSPKNARKSFITYVEGLSQADINRLNIDETVEPIDQSYRKAIARAMKHSVETQQKVYNQQSIVKMIEPATRLCGAIAEDYFLNVAAKRHLDK